MNKVEADQVKDLDNGLMLALEITKKVWKPFKAAFPESAVEIRENVDSWDRFTVLNAVADYLDRSIRINDMIRVTAFDNIANKINNSFRDTVEYYWLRKPIKDALDDLYPFPEMSLEFLFRVNVIEMILATSDDKDRLKYGQGDSLLREKCKSFCEAWNIQPNTRKRRVDVIANIKNRNKGIVEFWFEYIPLREALERELNERDNIIYSLASPLSIYRKFLYGNKAQQRHAATLIPALVKKK